MGYSGLLGGLPAPLDHGKIYLTTLNRPLENLLCPFTGHHAIGRTEDYRKPSCAPSDFSLTLEPRLRDDPSAPKPFCLGPGPEPKGRASCVDLP